MESIYNLVAAPRLVTYSADAKPGEKPMRAGVLKVDGSAPRSAPAAAAGSGPSSRETCGS